MTEEKKTTESENQANDTTIFDDGIETTVENQEEKTVESGQTDKQTKVDGDETQTRPINQEAVDKKINKVTFEKYEEKRKREEVERQLKEAQTQLEALKKPKQGEMAVPPMPDLFDPEYDQKVLERDQIRDKNAEIRAKNKLEQDRIARQNFEQAEKAKKETDTLVETMYKKAAELGFENEDFAKKDQLVAMFMNDRKHAPVARFILEDENSPLIVEYLAQNIAELEKVSQMTPVNAAVHISTVIKPEAAKLKPGTTKTPDPLDLPKGKGGGEKKSPYLDGVLLE